MTRAAADPRVAEANAALRLGERRLPPLEALVRVNDAQRCWGWIGIVDGWHKRSGRKLDLALRINDKRTLVPLRSDMAVQVLRLPDDAPPLWAWEAW